MDFLGIGSVIKGIGSVADDLFTSDEERLKIGLQERQVEAGLIKGQQEINKVEAQHQSIFVAGWRPFIGWVGGISLAYQFLVYPLLTWLVLILKSKGFIDVDLKELPVIDSGPLFALVMSMLGVGGMRSFDKFKNIDSKTVKK